MSKTRTVMIGCGGMARHHIRNMLKMQATTTISVVCEPSAQAYEETAAMFEEAGVPVPPNQPDLAKLLSDQRGQIDHGDLRTVQGLMVKLNWFCTTCPSVDRTRYLTV